jgi:hypothetical protein
MGSWRIMVKELCELLDDGQCAALAFGKEGGITEMACEQDFKTRIEMAC